MADGGPDTKQEDFKELINLEFQVLFQINSLHSQNVIKNFRFSKNCFMDHKCIFYISLRLKSDLASREKNPDP